jgi:hypothetical protein
MSCLANDTTVVHHKFVAQTDGTFTVDGKHGTRTPTSSATTSASTSDTSTHTTSGTTTGTSTHTSTRTSSATSTQTTTAAYARFECTKHGNFAVPPGTDCAGQVRVVNQLLAVCHAHGSATGASPQLTCPTSNPYVLLDEHNDGLGVGLLKSTFAHCLIGSHAALEQQYGNAIAVYPAGACDVMARART